MTRMPPLLVLAVLAALVAAPTTGAVQAPERTVTGLFSDPRPRPADALRQIAAPPESPFPPFDGRSTMLYDTHTGEAFNLGEGQIGAFSQDSAWMAWVVGPPPVVRTSDGQVMGADQSANEVWLLELATMERRSLGRGSAVRFLDAARVLLSVYEPGGVRYEIVEIATDERSFSDSAPQRDPGDPVRVPTDGGDLLLSPGFTFGTGSLIERQFTVSDPADGRIVLRFSAGAAVPAGPGELLVLTPSREDSTNLFIVEVATGVASFVATMAHDPLYIPVAADARRVIWTDNACILPGTPAATLGRPVARTFMVDRASGVLTEISPPIIAWLTLTPGGFLHPHAIGGGDLLDLETLTYTTVLPPAIVSTWSPDFRYASQGVTGPIFHGNFCH